MEQVHYNGIAKLHRLLFVVCFAFASLPADTGSEVFPFQEPMDD